MGRMTSPFGAQRPHAFFLRASASPREKKILFTRSRGAAEKKEVYFQMKDVARG
jgi:hypothetical protein